MRSWLAWAPYAQIIADSVHMCTSGGLSDSNELHDDNWGPRVLGILRHFVDAHVTFKLYSAVKINVVKGCVNQKCAHSTIYHVHSDTRVYHSVRWTAKSHRLQACRLSLAHGPRLPRVVEDDGAVGGGGAEQARLHRVEPNAVHGVDSPLQKKSSQSLISVPFLLWHEIKLNLS